MSPTQQREQRPASGPPRLAEALLRLSMRDRNARDGLLGDLQEEYTRLTRRGAFANRPRWAWYGLAVLGLSGRFLLARLPGAGGSGSRPPTTGDAKGRTPMIDTLLKDLRYAVRTLRKSPALTAVVVFSLALGVAANVSIFSLMNSWLLRPLPYPDADRLVMVYENNRNTLDQTQGVAAANYFDWQEQSSSFGEWVAATYDQANLTGIDTPQQLRVAWVTPNFFDMLGSETLVGRTFTPDEGGPDDDRVGVMVETVWRNQYGADEGILGDTIILDGQPLTVVGVMPETFDFVLGDVSLWVADDVTARRDDRTSHWYQVTGRLAEGVTLEQARADMEAIAARLEPPGIRRSQLPTV